MTRELPHFLRDLGQAGIIDQQVLAPLPPEYEPRFESAQEIRAFIDEKELLARLPISRRTAFTWVQSGKLPCVKIGRRKIFHWPSCVKALLFLQRGGAQ